MASEDEQPAVEDIPDEYDEADPQKAMEDSSEEEEEGSEEERAVREGFIADEDEEEEEEEEEDHSSRNRKRKRKHKHRHKHKDRKKHRSVAIDAEDEDEGLDEDDLELLAENTGTASRKPKRRLRRAGSVASDDLDLDHDDDLHRIFDDEDEPAVPRRRDGLGVDDELDDFIEEDEFPEDEALPRPKSTKRKSKASSNRVDSGRQKQAGRLMGALAPDVSGIDPDAWDEVMEVFGNGEDYEWALEMDEYEDLGADGGQAEYDGEGAFNRSTAVQLKDIFEPSQIKDRMLTEADEAIRLLDIPERTQLASATLANATSTEPLLTSEELDRAAEWVSQRISERCNTLFLQKDRHGFFPVLKEPFIVSVKDVLEFFLAKYLEVPFVFMNRKDYITHHTSDDQGNQTNTQFLNRDELWKVHTLSLKYVALLDRKKGLRRLFDKLDAEDDYFEECFGRIQSVEEVSDLMQWLTLKYGSRLREAQADVREDADALAADFMPDGLRNTNGLDKPVRYKKASRESRYERAKGSVVSKLASDLGISSRDLSADFLARNRQHFPDDPPLPPAVYAEEFAQAETEFDDSRKALEAAKLIVSTDIGRDPMLKKHVRQLFRQHGVVTVTPTDAGMSKITELHPYYAFKYLGQKPFSGLKQSSQYLQIIAAEQELLVNVQVHLNPEIDNTFKIEMMNTYKSDFTSELATSWNELREEILLHAIEHMLLPDAARWAKNYLKDEAEEYVAQRCAEELEERIDVAPYRPAHFLDDGEVPSVVAISNGAGDPRRDSTFVIYLDDAGRFRDHMKLDNLRDPTPRQDLSDFLQKRTPDVIVVGGFSASTNRLLNDVKAIAQDLSEKMKNELQPTGEMNDEALSRMGFPVIVARDDTARLCQQTKLGEDDFGGLPAIGRYCVALARYVQSPLNEYAAAGPDITAISFHPDQQFLPKDLLQVYLERALVNIVNSVGVDINRAVNDHYYQHLLQYVCGLGPRKAQKLIKMINAKSSEGTLISRNELITQELVTKNIFYNCAGFLRIKQGDLTTARETEPDILDDTRIHPEDYYVARKMAADAQELDEEDLAEQPPSQVVSDLLAADSGNGAAKLDDLNLDDFAVELLRLLNVRKRLTLYQIRTELQKPYAEKRSVFDALTPEQMFDLWTGENEATLSRGSVIPVKITKSRDRGLTVRLDSGIEGFIEQRYMVEEGTPDMSKFPVGSTIQALVMEIHKDRFMVELNSQPTAVAAAAGQQKKVKTDDHFDEIQMQMDKDRLESRKKIGSRRTQRVIKHPNFHNFNSGQAEQHLANQQRGDCVIRPSSKGTDHLAVTWKVDTGVYQHIDVLELDKQNEFSLGRTLKIGGRYSYSDLDELIVSHVRAMARKVEEMIAHERYKSTPEEMSKYLNTYLMANPDRSVYAFCIDKDTPGCFFLGFKADKNTAMQKWTVKVSPGAYELNGTQAGDMLSLCNAFKTQYTARSALPAAQGRTDMYGRQTPMLNGRTPINGGRTPLLGNRTPMLGSRTPLTTPRYTGTPQHAPPPPAPQTIATPRYSGGLTPAPPPPTSWNPGTPHAGYAPPPPPGPPRAGQPYPMNQTPLRYPGPPPPGMPPPPPQTWGPPPARQHYP
ncbi:SH2 domain-containing protein [Melampsora americana]|nr:SH2 domain-containing protein [Melampsora americana]KAH9811348.1 SH2 domain-containing protein [Melampsora americana]